MARIPFSSLPAGQLFVAHAGVVIPAAGASAYVYTHNTTTQVNVWSAEIAGSTLTQPLTADGDGFLPGWVDASQDLDVVATFAGQSRTLQAEPFLASGGGGGGGAVSSVFTRTGAVTASTGDYSVSQVTGAAPLASPTFTGTPAAPTPAVSDDSTKLATTGFVASAAGQLVIPAAVPVEYPGVGNAVAVSGVGDFLIRGANVRPGTGSFFESGFDLSMLNTQLDQMVAYGCNCVRYLGTYNGYASAPTTYATNFGLALQAAVNHNLRVIFCFISWFTDSPTSANLSSYTAMIDACLATGPSSNGNTWAGHPSILGWETVEEIQNSLSGDTLTLVSGLYTHMRSVAPTDKLTGNPSPWDSSDPATFGAMIASWDPYVDFHSPHVYPDTSSRTTLERIYSVDPVDSVRANTSKPILIGEAGVSTSVGGNVLVGTEERKAAFVKWLRRWAAGPNLMGACVWEWRNQTTNLFGLYDASNNPLPALAEWIRLPARSNAGAVDVTERRSSPVMLDDFHRPASTLVVGTSPIGGTPTATGVTWGINANRQAYVASGTGKGMLTWECHTGNVDIDLEFIVPAGACNIGIAARFTDASNHVLIQMVNVGGTASLKISKVVGGTTTSLGTYAGGPTSGTVTMARLRVKLRDTSVIAYEGDQPRVLGTLTDAVLDSTHTQHGIWINSSVSQDTGSVIPMFKVAMPNRYGP